MRYIGIAAVIGGVAALPLAVWADRGTKPSGETNGSASPCIFTSATQLMRADKQVVSVVLSNPPTTRARLIFQRGSVQHELEWDPALDPHLAQSFIAEQGSDPQVPWTVSVAIDPIILKQGSTAMMIFAGDVQRPSEHTLTMGLFAASTSEASATGAGSGAGSGSGSAAKAPPLQTWPNPTWTVSCTELPTLDKTPYAPTPGAATTGARGLGTIPEPVAQTLALLGEIALERAKSGALAILKSRFVGPFCGDDKHPGVRLSKIGLSGGGLAFPQSCALIQQLRLEDALASGKPLLRALRDDLRSTVAPAAIHRIAGDSAWGTLATGALDIVNRALDRGSFSALDAEAALDLFLDAMPFVKFLPLVGLASRALLESEVELVAKCDWTADQRACARELIGTMELAKLQAILPESARATVADAIAALEQLKSFEPKLLEQFNALNLKPSYFAECKQRKDTERELALCVRQIVRSWNTPGDVARTLEQLGLDANARKVMLQAMLDVVLARVTTKLDESTSKLAREITHVVQLACTARLAVGVVRRCSGEGCSNDRIKDMFDHPENNFKAPADNDPDQVDSDKVCWTKPVPRAYRVAKDELAVFKAFVTDGLELLAAASKQTPAARAAAVLRMFSRLSLEVADCIGGATTTATCRALAMTGDLLIALLEQDHAKALTAATSLVGVITPSVPIALIKGTQLIGTVAAYAQIFDETKTQDAAAASAARKKALEGLLDAATDRRGRAGNWVVSLGSNVGIGPVWTSPRAADPDATANGNPNGNSFSPQVRVPIALNLDHLPGEATRNPKTWPWHFGATIGDLGQFAAVGSDGKLQPVRWDNFLSPGVELGLLIGSPEQAFNITLHAEYAPALFASGSAGGAWRVGASLGYYVPFFDFN